MKNFPRLAGRLLALMLVAGSLGLSSCNNPDTTTVLGNWTPSSTFAGTGRSNAVSFVINNIAYVGTGIDTNSKRYNDFYAFNPATGSWTQVTPLPATARYNAVAFSAAGKGYVGTGYDGTNTNVNANYLSDFWQFDPTVNTTTTTGTNTVTTTGSWKRVADFPMPNGVGRYSAVAASVNDIGYVGCGYDGNYQKDFYQYDPKANTWTPLTNGFPGNKRMGALAFTINGQMYVGTGTNNNQYNTDFWAYNPAGGGTWTQKRYLANISTSTDSYDYSAVARAYASSFVIGNLGYVTVGSNSAVKTDCYAYDPTMDTWTATNPFFYTTGGGAGRNSAVSFSIGNYGYVGTGASGSSRFDDFWQFDPSAAQQ
ncbi:Kelch repeat-containing protein [Hymenobacter sp. BRD67]|uniref:Kelch repeat-containing protein n=1 Tax=Hymenobacter sp. BRD67 TaxID=2675877 RepID=UPI0015660796|nr:kelch repeat-containing protein [Hymenobacter sp. BRD67]QKG51981.1 galactose oxidase [Hymenobacter sp. BRD67]